MSEPTDLTLVAARSAAYQAWRDKVSKSPYVTMDADDILDTVLAAAAPVFRDGYLSAASRALTEWADRMPFASEANVARDAVTVVSRLKAGQ